MTIALYYMLAMPILGIVIMLLLGQLRFAGFLNILVSGASFVASLFIVKNYLVHGTLISRDHQFYIDAFNLLFIVLTTFVITTTACFSNKYMWHSVESGRITPKSLRLYHVMYQSFALTMLIVLTSNNIGIIWVAIEGATLATVLLVSLYRTPQAIEAAWKYFILCIVGIALALFGTILIYFAASKIPNISINHAIMWDTLRQYATSMDKHTVTLAFVFLLVGYGTKIGLVPLHNWLPDAHSESPAPMSTLLSGLLLNVALYVLLRFKIITDLALKNNFTQILFIVFGLFSFLVAVFLLYRQRNIKRMFSYSSIEHMGLITFAFGINTPLAVFTGLFYMLMHSLAKSAVFMLVGNVIQLTGSQDMDEIRGLLKNSPKLAWSFLAGIIAICGLPPFGIFICEFLLFVAAINYSPWLLFLLVLGFIVGTAGIFKNLQPIIFSDGKQYNKQHLTFYPAIVHLIIVLVSSFYLLPILNYFINQASLLFR